MMALGIGLIVLGLVLALVARQLRRRQAPAASRPARRDDGHAPVIASDGGSRPGKDKSPDEAGGDSDGGGGDGGGGGGGD
ncbi:MAG TPA: hypothetical protein VFV27_10515 [Nevskiaceae bacterium]|nr:hypothetical protein [Nevskiaceae bacterium]